jgi:hypothetical protein
VNIHFGTPRLIQSTADAVPLYGRKEFESTTRSTVPMLDLLIHSRAVFDKVIDTFGFPTQYHLHLEYTIGPFDGRGKASHTDVMLTSEVGSLAIEAKWTEPMYPAVKDWPEKGVTRTPNQEAVLNGWLTKLGQTASAPFNDVIYQMLHRAASAAVASRSPRLAYLVFKPSPDPRSARPDELFQQLTNLWNLLGTKAFPFHLVEIELEQLRAFKELPKTKGPATDEAVRAALQGPAPLFTFRQVRIRKAGTQTAPLTIDFQPASSAPEAVR